MAKTQLPHIITPLHFADITAVPHSRAFATLVLVVLGGIVMGLRFGWDDRPSLLIGLGLFGLASLMSYRTAMIQEAVDGPGVRTWGKSIRGLAAMVPLGIAFFLTFYQGLWEGRLLFESFSLQILLFRLASIYLGYRLAVRLNQLTDIMKHMSNGQLLVRDASPAEFSHGTERGTN